MLIRLCVLSMLVGYLPVLTLAAETTAPIVVPLMDKHLPALDEQQVLMLSITYPPGGSSAPHRHNANTFVYMLEGSVVMQVADGEEVTLLPGDTFYESRNDIHAVSRNASSIEPARFLVFMIKAPDAPVSVPLTSD